VEPDAWYAYAVSIVEGDAEAIAGVVRVRSAAPATLQLHPAVPNPFNPGTRVAFDIPGVTQTHVELAIYDVDGRLVRTLIREALAPGRHTFEWDGRDHQRQPTSSGIYILRLQAGAAVLTRKLIRVR
ncbi:MAG: T9SS type A sorting domain-containing protein, partial [Candidatus Latescibacterota bacterium]